MFGLFRPRVRHLTERVLSRALDGDLAADEQTRVETHLSSCAACSQQAAELRQMVGQLRAVPSLAPMRPFSLSLGVPRREQPRAAFRVAAAMAGVSLIAVISLAAVDWGASDDTALPALPAATGEPTPLITAGPAPELPKPAAQAEVPTAPGPARLADELQDAPQAPALAATMQPKDGPLGLAWWPAELALLAGFLVAGLVAARLWRRPSTC
ncbi:MAG: hypothetical protein EXR48_07545 [Dehalococcoidia bacterium]|nr:hypothetical protein [Dehalococcoidia bacterium]